MTLANDAVSALLTEIADLLELDGANQFRVRAYRNAAKTAFELSMPILAVPKLTDLPGIGADLAGKMKELATTGTTEVLDDVRKRWPPSARALLQVDGLGPKRVAKLKEALGIMSIDELKQAVDAGALALVPGLGASIEKKLKETLQHHSATTGQRFALADVLPIADDLVARVRALPGVTRAEAAGSLRRRKPTVGDLDILVCAADGPGVIHRFTQLPRVRDVLAAGDTRGSVKLDNDLQVDLRVVEEDSYGAALLYFTGSKNHSIELRSAAIKLGYKLNEYGVFENDVKLAGATEHQMYAALGMAYLAPEQRER